MKAKRAFDSQIKSDKFFRETSCRKFGNVKVYEVKTINQFSSTFNETVKSFDVSPGLCGYIVNVLGPYLALKCKPVMTKDEIDEILLDINEPDALVKMVEDNILLIRKWREKYIASNVKTFSSEITKKNYLRDLVANYEISDFLTQKKIENLYFFRQSAWFHPELTKEVLHEERERIEEEKPFAEKKFLIETFNPARKLISTDECKKKTEILIKKDQLNVFITDLLGHYVCFVALLLENKAKKLRTPILLLVDSTKGSYIGNTEEIAEIISLCFS